MNKDIIVAKIDLAIKLDKELKAKKKELDNIKAELQSVALADMENKNLKYKQLFGDNGSCDVWYREKFEVDSFELLKTVSGDIAEGKIAKKEEIKYEVESNFKKALIALYKGEYKNNDIEEILSGLGLDDKSRKVVVKKLKGDYIKDKKLLESLGIDKDIEEELDAIREAKNYELITRYFEVDKLDIENLKKAIWVEDSLSLGLAYEN